MKKILLSMLAIIAMATTTQAQLADGSPAKNFTFKDLNGNTHDLYTYLAQGKTVFIDCSAAWCGPCWSYHNKHHLKSLYEKHGPAGAPGVNSNTTNDCIVLFIEGEAANTHAQLYGPAVTTGGSAVVTQGDWVTGTPYPIIDTVGPSLTAFKTDYAISYFPTIYKICKDRLVTEIGQADSNALYASVASCPSYFPSAGNDAKLANYSISSNVNCSDAVNTKLSFQNYSTNLLTSATIAVYPNTSLTGTPLISIPWTGSLASYDVASITIPTFTYPGATNPATLGFKVTTAGDVKPINDTATMKIAVYDVASALSTPLAENFDAVSAPPASFNETTNLGFFFFYDGIAATKKLVGKSGTNTKAMGVDFYGNQSGNSTLVIGNFNSANSNDLSVSFDYSYAQYAGTENDKMEMVVSKDCGASWTSFWAQSGTTLSTHAAVGANVQYIPAAAEDWKTASAIVPASFNNVGQILLGLRATANYGNLGWIDNINISSATGINDVKNLNNLAIFPNPASTIINVNFETADVANIILTDVMGKVVYNKTATANNQINVANFANGVYSLSVITKEGTYTSKINVAH
jgi:Secretion system C-terminal sorting domain